MRKIKILTIILIVAIITMIAFFGIYTQVQNRMENQVKDYSYAMDLGGSRNIRLVVSDDIKTTIKDSEGKVVENSDNLTDEEIVQNGYIKEEAPYNSDDVKTVDNYKKSKEIIEKRFKELGVDNYIIKLDEATGDILIELKEDNNTDRIVSSLGTTGKFEIVDSETQDILMDNNDIKLANVMYGSNSTSASSYGTMVYLNIEFTKEGAKKLEDISSKYVKQEDTNTAEDTNTTEDTNTAEDANATTEETADTQSEEKTITMKIDDEELMTTSFDETMKTGKLQLSIGSTTTDQKTLQENANKAYDMAVVLDTGNMPVKYTVEKNEYVKSDISQEQLQIVAYVLIAVVILALIVFIVRYRTLGILGAISYIGLMSLFLILIRYANVLVSIEGIFGIAIVLILNYMFVNKFLGKLNKNRKDLSKDEVKVANKETYKEFFINIIPIIIMVVTFSFIKWVPISSFGMIMFWGIALIALYNVIITNTLLRLKAKK